MADSTKNTEVLYYKILSKGKEIENTFHLSFLQTSSVLNHIGKATLHFDCGNMEDFSFSESDSDAFKPGADIAIKVGYVKNEEKTIFEGFVINHGIRIEANIRPQFIVECRDYAYPATLGRKNNLFEKKKDSDICSQIMKTYGFSVSTDDTIIEHETLVQYYSSDWDFVRSRAEANGLVIHTQGQKISIKNPAVSGNPVIKLRYGRDLFSFNGSLTSSGQYEQVEALTWDPAKQQLVSSQASTPSLNSQGDITIKELDKQGGDKQICQSDAGIPQNVMKAWANAQALRNGLARYQGDFIITGNADVYPGCIVSLENIGNRFTGHVYVGGIEHSIKNGLWTTRILMGLSPDNITDLPDVTAPPASGLLPGIEGLHIGKVKQIHEDPNKEFRILVEIPLLNGNKKKLWARFCTLYASNGNGCLFLPEKEDEVVIGFFNNDPCYPVILGSMYSKQRTTPHTPEQKNDKKTIVTREKLTIEFEEEKKIIRIFTPAKNKIEIDDNGKQIILTDQHKNEILMDKSGIALNSSKDIVLKAKGGIHIEAGLAIEAKAKTDISAKGTNIKLTAQMGATVKGNATAELSASGRTVVKGGIVMIN